LNRNKNFIKE